MNTFQVERPTKAPDADVIVTIIVAGQTVTLRMTAEAWSRALASMQPQPIAAFKLTA